MDYYANFLNGNCDFYDEELLDNLRDKTYAGIPLHILILAYFLCRKNCHWCAILLTYGMDKFELVRGNVNIYEKIDEPNHSWVIHNGYVYDTTLGFKMKKEFYYKMFEAEEEEKYNEKTCDDYFLYRKEKENMNVEIDYERENLELVFKLLKYLEFKKSTLNGERLLKEINDYRKKYPYNNELPKKIVREYIRDMSKICLEGMKI